MLNEFGFDVCLGSSVWVEFVWFVRCNIFRGIGEWIRTDADTELLLQTGTGTDTDRQTHRKTYRE